ncbi:MAG: copper chaperone PCu(A)C [Rhodospirillaceae bacterium]|jgi:copper(I)-binding protein|nr:copper chaperone PCu(A)C [Rhodospirillaceae bacterium]
MKRIFLFLLCFIAPLGALSAGAHENSSGNVNVSHPWAAPAKAGGNTRLYLVIENDESEQITLLSLETPVARDARFHFQADDKTVLSLSSRSIKPEEALNVGTHHMWFELIGLRRDLVKGSLFPAVVTLADGRKIELTVIIGRTIEAHGES